MAGGDAMLTHLSIRDVVLIDNLDLEFESGLTVMTGETGAGKSIVLDALGLALGARADAGMIRGQADRLSVAASFLLAKNHPALGIVAEQGLEAEDGVVVLRRVVGKDGRGKAFVNDSPASAGLLKSIGSHLVEVHGQFDTHGLLDAATHLDVLDSFRAAAGVPGADDACATLYTTWRRAERELADVRENIAKSLGDRDYLTSVVDDLVALDPKAGEERDLIDRRTVLKNADQIRTALVEARQALSGNADVESQLRAAHARIARTAASAGGRLDDAAAALERAVIEASEAAAAIERALDGIDPDPAALEKIDERLFQLRSAARKHHCQIDELVAVRERLAGQLAEISASGARLSELAEKAAAAKAAFERSARALHAARRVAAETLDRAVAKELPPLKLDKSTFRTAVAEVGEDAWSARGLSRVTFEVATNPGSVPGPLAKIASGGELARFMLALKVVLAASVPPCTMIFDEVDAGISGATANAVGERLSRLARSVQVFVVTHSAQVAARATHHWRVSKASRSGATTTRIEPVAAARRREEIARMLSGANVTDEARAAAESLLSGPPS